MKKLSWDDLHLFLHVARGGGLSAAARTSGLSPATVGRQMLVLEEALGQPLFDRRQTGYRLTREGQALFERLLPMEASARDIEAWQAEGEGRPLVRIACGTWLGWFFARHMPALQTQADRFRLDFTIAEQRASLTHRESDIGIRAVEPEEPNLAARKLCDVAYAAYRLRGSTAAEERWIAVAEDAAISAYLAWPHRHHAAAVAVLVNRPRSLRDMAASGAGLAVLPCFVGDQDRRLERAGPEIAALRHRQWIVTHADGRHRAEVRTVAARMTSLVREARPLFEGRGLADA
ncbi:LysR family transcriptional regulator [Gellertiella hungarica]|uniref:DNA-binding transcriptional LysR family regulator n=1 Tax=Gellertiella hungarica TaxID=1572859 RepID=A0A7W6J8A3_9HYPH|nr:LysR family transcriptional regulator [Gellertiella hungarica]MBB4066634.1 DNA-binding transcriptional LysR family regulator [Gellertiella hungarica]